MWPITDIRDCVCKARWRNKLHEACRTHGINEAMFLDLIRTLEHPPEDSWKFYKGAYDLLCGILKLRELIPNDEFWKEEVAKIPKDSKIGQIIQKHHGQLATL